MAISLTTSTIPLFNNILDSSSIGSKPSNSLQFPRHLQHHYSSKILRVSSLPQRRILPPRVEATKQTFSSFDDLLANSDKPVLVDFYATWCGPCQYMVPVLDQVSATLKDKIQVVKIDTEKYPTVANQYRIEALPTLIIFKDGKPCDRFEGALTPDQLIKRIETVLSAKK
ncbi:hypothetical protein Scep_002268 [Stephania cephalantha]|uniref:Thioredoxin domain-containing protein n=1 Tax=Stephania cephalantha TaxID=152367 RepID=A0AAP0Q452_9MAGN